MKKVLIAIIMCIAMSVQAQEMEYLDSIHIKDDPLYPNSAGVVWQSKHMYFKLYEKGGLIWNICNPPHIFVNDKWAITGKDKGFTTARVGLFAENDSLLAIVEKWKAIPSEHGTILKMGADATFDRPNGQKTKGNIIHVFGTLLKRKGSYVRVVVPVYGDYLFEVKATMR